MNSGLNVFGLAVLAAWLPLIFVMFATMSSRRAVIAAFVIGYLFLPDARFAFHTLPDISKVSLTAVGVLLATLCFDPGKVLRFRPRWIDIAALALSFSPITTSISNGLGFMDGLANSANRICTWSLAYLIGRLYFTDWAAVRELAIGIVMGGLAYVPLCWWEIRMSPQLHGELYGMQFLSFRTDSPLFGYRPNVFLANGLTVTMFMGVCTVIAYWLWMSGSLKKLWTVPAVWIFLTLLITTIFCKALGGVILTFAGIGVLTMIRWPKTKLAVLAFILAPPVYMYVRTSGWQADEVVKVARMYSVDRANSLEYRLKVENMMTEKARRQPWLGWGGWNRSHVYDLNTGRDLVLLDGLWIIMLGEYGLVGLSALLGMVLIPALLVWKRIPTPSWLDPACGAAVALAVISAMYMVDGLFNATFNPLACLAAGAVGSISAAAQVAFARRRARAYAYQPQPAVPVVASPRDLPFVNVYRSSQT